MNNGYVQVPCTRCGTTVWIPQQASVGYCPSCQTPNSIPGAAPAPPQYAPPQGAAPYAPPPQGAAPYAPPQGAAPYAPPQGAAPYAPPPPQGAAPYGPPAGFAMPVAKPGLPVMRIVGAIGGAVVVAAVAAGGYFLKSQVLGGGGKGRAGYATLHIDPDKADPDACITAVQGLATKWKSDAGWWSANFNYVGPDGLMDLSKGGVQVTYISPSRVASAANSVRKDSVKEFTFGPSGVGYGDLIGAKDPWKGVEMPPAPGCGVKQLAASLASKGLVAGKVVHISFDPKFARMVDGQSWHVMGDDPKIDAWYSMVDCHQTR